MVFHLKILFLSMLFGIELNLLRAHDDIGEGTMDLKDLEECFIASNCIGDAFVEFKSCYDMLDEEVELRKSMNVIGEAGLRINVTFLAATLPEMRDEFCALSDKKKKELADQVTESLLDMYAGYCMSHKTKRSCDNLENCLDCGFTIMERYSNEGKCAILEEA